jgi:deoxyribonuclease V
MNFIKPDNLISNNKLNTQQAIQYQREWAALINTNDDFADIQTIGGIDIAYDIASNRAFATAIILDARSLTLLEVKKANAAVEVPYRPGFLSFREVPALTKAIDQLSKKPDLIVCDGQGIAHPRRFGLACHLGLIYDIPTIGCGKSKLFGIHEAPGEKRGDFSYLYDRQQTIIGCVLRTRAKVNPVYISTGHKISLASACQWILHLSPKYRLPETTRLADSLADVYKMEEIL